VTALGNPLLLERWSDALYAIQDLFERLDVDKDEKIARSEFRKVWGVLFNDSDVAHVDETFNAIDKDHTGRIDPYEWMTYLEPSVMAEWAQRASGGGEEGRAKEVREFIDAALTVEEQNLLANMRQRIEALVALAAELDVRPHKPA
jgi:Ca2+-binding EF-hand superfamily protein